MVKGYKLGHGTGFLPGEPCPYWDMTMNDKLLKIDLRTTLADSELLSYHFVRDSNTLRIKFQMWDGGIIKIYFYDVILFVDHCINNINGFYQNTENGKLMDDALKATYEITPTSHPYKLFQFINLDNNPCIEIICNDIQVKNGSSRAKS